MPSSETLAPEGRCASQSPAVTAADGDRWRGRSAVFLAPGKVEVREEETPALAPGQVRVRLRACGLCTMEQRLWLGAQSDYPMIPGHEAAGEVEEVHREGVLGVAPGDRVTVAFLDRCMECFHCRRGETELCVGKLEGREPGKLRRIGGLARYAVVPAWKLFPMPAEVSWDELTLAEPLACVAHSVRRGDLRLGDDVVVLGAGTMGHLHLLLARLRGTRVFVSDPDADKRRLAVEHGAAGAFPPEELAAQVQRRTGGRGADAVFVTFGSAETAAAAAACVRSGGRIVYYGSFPPQAAPGLGPREIHRREICLDGARGQTLEDWTEATRLLSAGLVKVGHLVSASFPLDRLEEALRHATEVAPFRVVVYP